MKKEIVIGVASSLVTALLLFLALSVVPQAERLATSSMSKVAGQSEMTLDEAAAPTADGGSTMLAYSFSAVVKVPDLPVAEASAKSLVDGFGGYLAGVSGSYERQKSTTLRFKVPSDSLEEAAAALKQLGEVDEESLSAYDVKSQYDELSSRIESYEAERERLLEFYGEANDTSDLIEISSRLSFVESQLTYLNLRKAELEDAVSYSDVSVTLQENMGALSKFVLVDLADLFSGFSSGINASLTGVFWIAGLLLPVAAIALVVFLLKPKKKKR